LSTDTNTTSIQTITCNTFSDAVYISILRVHTKIICRSYTKWNHGNQGDNPGQENRGLDGVLYKLLPFVSDIAILVLKRDVQLQLTN